MGFFFVTPLVEDKSKFVLHKAQNIVVGNRRIKSQAQHQVVDQRGASGGEEEYQYCANLKQFQIAVSQQALGLSLLEH